MLVYILLYYEYIFSLKNVLLSYECTLTLTKTELPKGPVNHTKIIKSLIYYGNIIFSRRTVLHWYVMLCCLPPWHCTV